MFNLRDWNEQGREEKRIRVGIFSVGALRTLFIEDRKMSPSYIRKIRSSDSGPNDWRGINMRSHVVVTSPRDLSRKIVDTGCELSANISPYEERTP